MALAAVIGPMSKPQGRCIFCGGTRLSKEHIWSDWLDPILPKTPEHAQVLRSTYVDENPTLSRGFPPEKRVRQGSLNQRKVRNVCQNCNNGWMSRAVSQARPLASAMIHGRDLSILTRGQSELSLWLTILVTTAEFLDRRHMSITDSERTSIYKNQIPVIIR